MSAPRILPLILATLASLITIGCTNAEEEIDQESTPTASPTTSPTPSPPQESDGAAALASLTYVNPRYGYSFEYPATWLLSPGEGDGGYVALFSYDPAAVPPGEAGAPVPPDKLKVEFLVLDNPEQLALEAWIKQDRETGAPVEVLSSESVIVGGVVGIVEVVDTGDGSFVQYFFLAFPGSVFVINQYPADSMLAHDFTTLLSTFTFDASK